MIKIECMYMYILVSLDCNPYTWYGMFYSYLQLVGEKFRYDSGNVTPTFNTHARWENQIMFQNFKQKNR